MDSRDTKVTEAFFALLKAGLWEKEIRIEPYMPVDLQAVYELANNQSVVGPLAAGLDQVRDRKIVKTEAVPFLKKVIKMENRNASMDAFVKELARRLGDAGIPFLLLKGQGIARCYKRPQWRYCGDVDLLFSNENFEKAKAFFRPLVKYFDPDNDFTRHISTMLGSFELELHADQHPGLSYRIDNAVDRILARCLEKGEVRIWDDGGTQVMLPAPDNDVILVFTHILKHFYKGGIGLRQLCDLSRLLWTYRESIDRNLLGERLREMRLMTEWKAFGYYCVNYLGMPSEAMPYYEESRRWARKAQRINRFILKVGTFGINRDSSYYQKYPFLIRKSISLLRRLSDLLHHGTIFPLNSLRFLPRTIFGGLESAVNGQ